MSNPTDFSFDVFLSYNSKDRGRVRRLAERLRGAGVRVWFDEWVIRPGDDIYLTIEHGLGAARTLVLWLSPTALGSDWVGLEGSTDRTYDGHLRRGQPDLPSGHDVRLRRRWRGGVQGQRRAGQRA